MMGQGVLLPLSKSLPNNPIMLPFSYNLHMLLLKPKEVLQLSSILRVVQNVQNRPWIPLRTDLPPGALPLIKLGLPHIFQAANDSGFLVEARRAWPQVLVEYTPAHCVGV